jgi:TetR/AcrR family transcriptional regulator, transcriptional repressor for nem operon
MGRISDAKQRLMEAVRELVWKDSYGSTTIDQICEKAGVKKGSFYYFFESKADLAVTAIDADWQQIRLELDTLFSPTIEPLERIRKYLEYGYCLQERIKTEYGRVLGCPLFSVGAEVSTQEDRLQKKIQEILEYKRKYLESAIRDAHAQGLIYAPDPAAKSRAVAAYMEGLLTQARIQNNLEILCEAPRGVNDLLGLAENAVPK